MSKFDNYNRKFENLGRFNPDPPKVSFSEDTMKAYEQQVESIQKAYASVGGDALRDYQRKLLERMMRMHDEDVSAFSQQYTQQFEPEKVPLYEGIVIDGELNGQSLSHRSYYYEHAVMSDNPYVSYMDAAMSARAADVRRSREVYKHSSANPITREFKFWYHDRLDPSEARRRYLDMDDSAVEDMADDDA